MAGRQKYIELRCFCEYAGTVIDPDEIPVTIEQLPATGTLTHLTGSTYVYIPDEDSALAGVDNLKYCCEGSLIGETEVSLIITDDFVPPLGLGAPGFGIEEEWTDYANKRPPGRIYFVDPENGCDYPAIPQCQNAAEDWPYGTPQRPRRTIPTSLVAGDVVQLSGEQAAGGPIQDPLKITASGSFAAPIFIRGYGPSNRATLRRPLHIVGDYVIIEYIDFDAARPPTEINHNFKHWVRVTERVVTCPVIIEEASSAMQAGGGEGEEMMMPNPTASVVVDSSHVVVRHCSFLDHPTGMNSGVAAVLFGATANERCSPNNPTIGVKDCVAYDILVANFGTWNADTGVDYYGAGAEANTENTWILDSVFHHLQGGGAGLSRTVAESYQLAAHKGWIARNVIHHVREYGIAVKMAKDAILSQNKIYRIRMAASTSTGGGIYIGNNDRCNQYVNESADRYSNNIWAIFNHIYDVQTGVSISQKVFCGGGGCCCPDCPDQPGSCPGNTSCCASSSTGHPGPTYEPSRIYVVGNIFNHILPFCTTPTSAPPLTETPFCGAQFCAPPYCDEDPACDELPSGPLPCCDPSLCINPGAYGQAVVVGHQSQVRYVNNTVVNCAQALQILSTYDPSNPNPDPKDCPPGADETHGEQGKRRNTQVWMVNNAIVDTPDDGLNDSQVRVSTGPYDDSPPGSEVPFTLTDGQYGFGHNLFWGLNRMFQLPSGQFFSIEDLVDDILTDYGIVTYGDSAAHDPKLLNPAMLQFDLQQISPSFMFIDGVRDESYDEFQSYFGRSIYHDYDGHLPYHYYACPIGAFGD